MKSEITYVQPHYVGKLGTMSLNAGSGEQVLLLNILAASV